MTVLVLTPIEEEFAALTEELTSLGLPSSSGSYGRISGRSYADGALFVAQGGLGKAQFGIQTQHLLDRIDGVSLAVCAGTAGGLAPELAIGDVVVGTSTVEHDFNFVLTSNPLPRFEGYGLHVRGLRIVAGTLRENFEIHFGTIASGDEGIADGARARELKESTGAVAVAWEGAGGARAARFSDVPFLELRGISDDSNDEAVTQFDENIPFAMKNVAFVVRGILEMPLTLLTGLAI